MKNPLSKVVVITGASSGLGRASAIELARRGCALVLASRNETDLEDAAARCRTAGAADVLVVRTDITKQADTEALVERALSVFGRIDVWVNNAGVTAFGFIHEGDFENHRRVIETNVIGTMLCVRAVLPVFERQRSGIIINVASTLAKIGQPFVPSYVVSKFGVLGLSEALRTAYADQDDIHICTLLPYAIDTPHFEAGANEIGLRAHAMPPMQSPEKVARALVSLVERPRRQLHVPRYIELGIALHGLLPNTVETMVLHLVREWHFDENVEKRTKGNLYRPAVRADGKVRGTRPARLGLPTLLAWAAGHFIRRLARKIARASTTRAEAVEEAPERTRAPHAAV